MRFFVTPKNFDELLKNGRWFDVRGFDKFDLANTLSAGEAIEIEEFPLPDRPSRHRHAYVEYITQLRFMHLIGIALPEASPIPDLESALRSLHGYIKRANGALPGDFLADRLHPV